MQSVHIHVTTRIVKALISPQGAYVISGSKRGGLITEGM